MAGQSTEAKIDLLIVEDDKFLQKILLTKFQKEGFDVRLASDGEEGLRLMLEKPPGLILLDLILPKLDGFQVMSEMRTNPRIKNIPVVIISNLSQEEDKRRASELGAVEFLVKANLSINEIVQSAKEAYAKFAVRQ